MMNLKLLRRTLRKNGSYFGTVKMVAIQRNLIKIRFLR